MDVESAPAAEPPRPPDRAALKEAALAHLARFGTTEHGLRQVLGRRAQRWGRRAVLAGLDEAEAGQVVAALKPVIADIVTEMARLGAVDDAQFAASRSRSLTRSGRSTRAISAHLAARGVTADVRTQALESRDETLGDDADLVAALVLARKRRVGPFARPDAEADDVATRHRAFGVLARAGFSRDIAARALSMDEDEAMTRIIAMKSA